MFTCTSVCLVEGKKFQFLWRGIKTTAEQISRKGIHDEYNTHTHKQVWSSITFSDAVSFSITGCLLNKLIHNSKGFVKGRGIIELNSMLFPRKLSLHWDLQGDASSIYTHTHTHTQARVGVHTDAFTQIHVYVRYILYIYIYIFYQGNAPRE